MRVVLIGSESDRGRLHPELAAASIDVVGEFPTLAAAQSAGMAADAFLVARRNGGHDSDESMQEKLTPREISVLHVLMTNANRALSRDQLMRMAWGSSFDGMPKTVDVCIQRLRHAKNAI